MSAPERDPELLAAYRLFCDTERTAGGLAILAFPLTVVGEEIPARELTIDSFEALLERLAFAPLRWRAALETIAESATLEGPRLAELARTALAGEDS